MIPEVIPFHHGEIKLFRNTEYRLYYCIPEEADFVYVRVVGYIPPEPYHQLIMSIFQDESWRNGLKNLTDARWGKGSLSFDKMYTYVKDFERDLIAAGVELGDQAIITGGELGYGVGRMYESLSDQEMRKILATRIPEEAVEFLGINQILTDDIIDRINQEESK